MKSNIKSIIKMCIVLSIMAFPAMAATNDSLLTPGMGMAWYNSQSQDFKDLMFWIFGGAIFIVGAAYIIFSAFGATASHYENTFGSQDAKARHSNTLLRNFGILILMIAVILIGRSIFSWF